MSPMKETTPSQSEDEALDIPEVEENPVAKKSTAAKNQKGTVKKAGKNAPIKFSKESQIELAEWLRSHPILYDRSLDEFHMPDKKNQLWEAKAIELAPRHPTQTVTGM